MPKGYLGTAREGNSLVQDEVEVENTLAIISWLNLGHVLPRLLHLALLGTSEALAHAVKEFPAGTMVSEAPTLKSGRKQQEQEQKECRTRHAGTVACHVLDSLGLC